MQIGCFIPVGTGIQSALPILDNILVRVGAGDNQMLGVSTFYAEMLEMNQMLEQANERSLCLVDEIGRGTSTADGFSIAYAIAEQILKVNRSFCLFATHFHEFKILKQKYPEEVTDVHTAA